MVSGRVVAGAYVEPQLTGDEAAGAGAGADAGVGQQPGATIPETLAPGDLTHTVTGTVVLFGMTPAAYVIDKEW